MIFLIIVIVLMILIVLSKIRPPCDYDNDLARQEWEQYLFPVSEYLWNVKENIFIFCKKKSRKKGKRQKFLKQIFVDANEKEIVHRQDLQMIAGMLLFVMAGCMLGFLSNAMSSGALELKKGYVLQRKEPGQGEKKVSLKVKVNQTKKDLSISIPERSYTDEELEAMFQKGKKYIKDTYLRENESEDKVTKQLNLLKQIPKTPIKVAWELPKEQVVEESGKLRRASLKEPLQLELRAILSYEKNKVTQVLSITVLPQKISKEQSRWLALQNKIKKSLNGHASEKTVFLPTKIFNARITYAENRGNKGIWLFLICAFIAILLPVIMMERLKQKVEERNQELLFDYPEFVDRIILLLGAGLTMKGTWYRLTEEYEKKQKRGERKRYLFEEMLLVRHAMENGVSEMDAYEQFGKNIGLFPYMKFASLVTQNIKKGSGDILRLLERESTEALQMRRNQAKIMGEKAGTKLLVPMIIMLAEVFTLIIVPAFWSM